MSNADAAEMEQRETSTGEDTLNEGHGIPDKEDTDFNMQRYEEDESDHSLNGWIKKEPEDEDELDEEYLKHRQESGDPGDHYEDLVNMSKEELVGRILQQEEDIRFLQDIRNGLEKTVQELSSTVNELQTIVKDVSSIASSLKGHQASASTSQDIIPPVSSSTRSSENIPKVNEANLRPTPSSSAVASSSLASTKTVPTSRNNSRLTESSQSFSKSIVPAKEKTNNTHSALTILKSNNVVIKTEIPSPPPEPEILDDPFQMASYAANKRKVEPQQSYQVHQQSQSQNVQIRTLPQRTKQKTVPFPQQQQHIQQRVRMTSQRANVARGHSIQQSIQTQIQQAGIRMPNPRFSQNTPRMQVRATRGMQDFPMQMQQRLPHPGGGSGLGRPRLSNVKISTVPTTTSPMTNVLAEIGAKLPKSLSLSLVSASNPMKTGDASRSVTIKASDASDRPMTSALASSSAAVSGNLTKPSVGKVITSNAVTSSTTSSSDHPGKVIHYGTEDDEDDENDYDEIAVLEPDKKIKRFLEDDNDKDSNQKKNRSSELTPANWSAQNNPAEPNNRSANMYHNNDEYMLDDAMDDTDIDESDPTAVYLGEDVTLSKDVLQNIIKEAMNHEQLIKNLMNVLFPDLAQLAAESNVDANKSYTVLSSSKVNAIIELCRKRFPFKNKNDIFSVINMKFQEAKNASRNNRSRMQYTKQY